MARRLRVLIMPSWYPRPREAAHGIFVQQQAQALATVCDAAVIHVPLDSPSTDATMTHEGDLAVVRAAVRPGGVRRLRYAYTLALGYRRSCLAALRVLMDSWGTPDVIHAHASVPAALGARLLSRRLGVPLVITEHQAGFLPESPGLRVSSGRLLPRLARRAMRDARAVVAVSRHLADALVAGGYCQDPIVIPNLIPGTAQPARPVAPQPDNIPRIVHVSLLNSYEKNIPMLLDALKLLDGRGVEFAMEFIGDGPDRRMLESRASELGLLGRKVNFIGAVSGTAVREAFDAASFSIVSSRYETFSMAAAESLAAGRPVVSTRCGGPEDFIDDTVGMLVENDDAQAMADAVEWMCGHHMQFDPGQLHLYAQRRFSTTVVIGELLDLYRLVLDAEAAGEAHSHA